MRPPIAAASLAVLASVSVQAAERRDPRIEAAIARIEAARLQATVGKLVSFGTRHTLSDTKSEARGIGAARRWLRAQFAEAARLPGSRLVPFEDRFTAQPNARIPNAVELVNVGAILRGSDASRAKQAIVMTGHYDSRASDPLDATSDAPGANDDGSGTSMAVELARAFAAESPAVSIYFVAVAGEEQGLVGSAHLAERLAADGVDVLAMVSVDIAGNSQGDDGVVDSTTARLFAEGVPSTETPQQKRLREAIGLENDGRSRELARYVARVGSRYAEDLRLRVMLRRDRIARGSDHMPFMARGMPAMRFSEAREAYRRQHQNVRDEAGQHFGDVPAGFDARYAARMCRALGAALLSLALAPAAPDKVVQGGANSSDTRLSWSLSDPRAADVVLYRRGADSVAWERARSLGKVTQVTLPSVIQDDHFFALATADAAGNESLPQVPSALGK